VSKLISLARDLLLDQVVLALVLEDDVNLAGGRTANIGAEHNAKNDYVIKSDSSRDRRSKNEE
jgi:hypothetical protein